MTKDRYNILFLNKFYYLKGGSERVFFEEMSILEQHGHKCIPFSRRSPQNEPSEYERYFAPYLALNQGVSIQNIRSAVEIVYSKEVKRALSRLISTIHPDIAHTHNTYGLLTTSVLDELYSRGIPTVMSLHDYKIICPNYQFLKGTEICEDCKTHRYYKAVQNKCVHGNLMYSSIYAFENYFNYLTAKYHKKVAKFIAVSRFIKDKFVEFGFPHEQIVVIPNFINSDQYEAHYQHEKYFLYFGRLSSEKGVQTLLKAFRLVNIGGFKLVIVGDGPLRLELKDEALQSGVDKVEFTGFLSGTDLANKVKRSTCVIVPSEWYENCPMSVLEALAYGKPVIGANIGGIPELIQDGTDGFLFQSGNVDDLAAKLDHVIDLSSREYEQMARNAREKVERCFNADQHYESLLELYNGVLN
jgi:glycosyltransferase involved in cell wall biosynthesis